MIGTTTAEVLRAYSYQVADAWYATVAARKALARTVEPVPFGILGYCFSPNGP